MEKEIIDESNKRKIRKKEGTDEKYTEKWQSNENNNRKERRRKQQREMDWLKRREQKNRDYCINTGAACY